MSNQQFTEEQLEKQREFLESKCDLFDSADFQYYAEATGRGIDWVMANAKYADDEGIYGTVLTNAIADGDFEMGDLLW